jgi:hypothetical protein
MIRAIASAFAVASIATSSVSTRLCANSASVAGSVSARRSHDAVLGDRDLAVVAMHVRSDTSHPALQLVW